MTESSAYWDGNSIGDAAAGAFFAPYDAETEFNRIFGRTLASDAQGFVLPSLLNNLNVQASSPVASTIDVATGGAYVKGFHYLNDALNTLTVAANASGNPRLDRIIIRIDWSAKTVRLAVLQGTAAATPTLPALTQVYGTTWEISLAYIWLANGFATIGNAEIHDERAFARNLSGDVSGYMSKNLIHNNEFMAFSRLSTIPVTSAGAPDRWQLVGTVTTWASVAKPSVMSRGRYVGITAGAANSGMSQTVRVKPSTTYTIRLVHSVTVGDTASISVTTNSASPVPITRTTRRTATDITETIVYTTESDASTMTISLLCSANTDIVSFGQILCIEGFTPGPFREFSEIIIFDSEVGDTNWGADAKSSSDVTLDLDTDFQTIILPGTKALYMVIWGRDSASAANTGLHLSIHHRVGSTSSSIFAFIAGVTNDANVAEAGWANVDINNQFEAHVLASGAGTLDATLLISGIQT